MRPHVEPQHEGIEYFAARTFHHVQDDSRALVRRARRYRIRDGRDLLFGRVGNSKAQFGADAAEVTFFQADRVHFWRQPMPKREQLG